MTLKHQKWPQTDPKVSPKSPSYVKSDPKNDVKLTSSTYKTIKISGESLQGASNSMNLLEKQKRPNTEPQGAPGGLETFIR